MGTARPHAGCRHVRRVAEGDFFPRAQRSGVPQVVAVTQLAAGGKAVDSLVSLRIALSKVCVGAFALVGSFSAGREGPSVQVAAGDAQEHSAMAVESPTSCCLRGPLRSPRRSHRLGQWLHILRERLRHNLANRCGADGSTLARLNNALYDHDR